MSLSKFDITSQDKSVQTSMFDIGTSKLFLSLSELGHNIFVLRFRPKTSSCQLP